MKVGESCAACLYDKQQHLTEDKEYLAEVRQIIDDRTENDTAPYLVYLFNQAYERRFGKRASYKDIKKTYNDLVLSIEDNIREKIEKSRNSLETAFVYARIGNYIDFGAMNTVDEKVFLELFDNGELHERDRETYISFTDKCLKAESFLLIADNCGEIVLDKLFIEQLKKDYPKLDAAVMIRGEEVLNDATIEDARYTGIDKVARIVSNGSGIAGTVYEMLNEEAKTEIDSADVILSKGQGNYESLCGQGRDIFYSFLCKCDLFTGRFNVPRLTGIFIEEK
ncbi:MAG: ARMT1-like domain-containing protein [Lachnospiraceae bacterium]|nr:ARMT1-like domain-containing protein [Lachnospiraceae bacterium]